MINNETLSDPKDIRYILDILGLTVDELANDLELSRSTVSNLINGTVELKTVYRYAIVCWANEQCERRLGISDETPVVLAIRAIVFRNRHYNYICRVCDEVTQNTGRKLGKKHVGKLIWARLVKDWKNGKKWEVTE